MAGELGSDEPQPDARGQRSDRAPDRSGRWPIRYVGAAAVGIALLAVALGIGLFGSGLFGDGPARPAGLGGVDGTTGAGTSGPSGAATPTVGATGTPTPTPAASRTATAPPPRTTGGRPGPTNTGVPPGTKLRVLNGDQEFSTDNQVISGIDVHGVVRITGRNITIKNSIFRGGGPRCNSAVLETEDGFGATITDSEINPDHPHPCLDGIWAENATLLRLNVHGAVDGVKAFDNVILQDSWIHDLSWFASDPNQGGGPTHNDCVQTYEGNRNILIRHNTMDAGAKGNAAYQVTQDFGHVATDLHIENNFLDGGGCSLNFAHKGGPTPMTGIYVVNNRFGRHSFYQCPILVSTQTQLSQNSGNVWDDTGKPIPPPERHD